MSPTVPIEERSQYYLFGNFLSNLQQIFTKILPGKCNRHGYCAPDNRHGCCSPVLPIMRATRCFRAGESSLPVKSLRRRTTLPVRCSSGDADAPSPSVVLDSDFDAKKFCKNLTRRDNYNRKGFGHKEETLKLMNREYTSDILETLKSNGYTYSWGDVTMKLAKAYGFCWG